MPQSILRPAKNMNVLGGKCGRHLGADRAIQHSIRVRRVAKHDRHVQQRNGRHKRTERADRAERTVECRIEHTLYHLDLAADRTRPHQFDAHPPIGPFRDSPCKILQRRTDMAVYRQRRTNTQVTGGSARRTHHRQSKGAACARGKPAAVQHLEIPILGVVQPSGQGVAGKS